MRKITNDEFCNMSFLSNITFSPNGKNVCLTVARADKEKNRYESNIYYKKGSKFEKLTGLGKEGSFKFLDDKTVMFSGNREDKKEGEESISTIFYSIRLDGGEAKKLIEMPIPVEELIPVGKDYIVVGSTFPGYEDLYKNDKKLTAKYLKDKKDNADYEVIDTVPWWFNGTTFTRGEYSRLYFYDHITKKLSPLTKEGYSVYDVKLSDDKKSVYYMKSELRPYRSFSSPAFLSKIDLETKVETEILESKKGSMVEGFFLGKSFILLLMTDDTYGLNTDCDFYKLSYDTNEVTKYADWKESIGSSVGSDVRHGGGRSAKMVDDTFYFISTRWDSAYLFKLEDGVITQLTEEEGSVDTFDVCGDKILMIALYDMQLQEVYDQDLNQVSGFNTKVLKNKYVAVPEDCNFVNADHEVHGFVLYPIDYDSTKKYPCIFDIHGGPKTVYGPVFYHEMQYWANLGYFVVFANPTGSDGRGSFMDIRGKYGTIDYEDLMMFMDTVLERYPAIDKDEVFETGGSYGGFMTNWIIGHTDRFRACASQRSISNWFSFYGVSDIGVEFAMDQNLSDPWTDPEKLWFHSPMKYADKVKTPTLFIHSFEDYRCPIDQGYQMFTSLVAHGVESKMVTFKGENHELSRGGKPLHRLRRIDEITSWFEKHRK